MTFERANSRREFLKKSAYAAPVILTLVAVPAVAETGSPPPGPDPNDREKCNNGLGQRTDDCQPPGNPPINDKPASTPGEPNNQGGNN